MFINDNDNDIVIYDQIIGTAKHSYYIINAYMYYVIMSVI